MSAIKLEPTRSVLIVVDVQPTFLKGIHEAERVLARATFMARAAEALGVTVLATEQVPERMGGTHPGLSPHVGTPFPKRSFSCVGCEDLASALEFTGRRQAVLVGIETHICVGQTAQDLLALGYEVAVCPDGVSAGSLEAHKLGMERMRDAGIVPVHTEAVAYEWMGTAEHFAFRQILGLVKQYR
jgi:nicotinamidase-related amidase